MIKEMRDRVAYRQHRDLAWSRNGSYWLSQPLRHVVDVGELICQRVSSHLSSLNKQEPVIVDMGCGSCWLLQSLSRSLPRFRYIGIDNNAEFIDAARSAYSRNTNASFCLADLDMRVDLDVKADMVVNAFNFFELADLDRGMSSAAEWLNDSGRLLMSTIDKTYLILALSSDWRDFRRNLRTYQNMRGIKYDFQRIDLGDRLSGELEYPSVLYSTQDFIESAAKSGLTLRSYSETAFTARAMPKIYCHLEFGLGK